MLDEQERFKLAYKKLIPIVGVMAMVRGEKLRVTVYQVDKPSIASQARISRDYHRLSGSDRSVAEMQDTLAIFGFRMEVVEYALDGGLGVEEREKLASFKIM